MSNSEMATKIYESCKDMDFADYEECREQSIAELERELDLLPNGSALKHSLLILTDAE